MNLLIVESPNKIKKIKAILGTEWEVAASVGHIRDLPAKGLAIDKIDGYKMLYQINEDKKQVVESLKRKVRQVGKENIWLATDPDREGRPLVSISARHWDLTIRIQKELLFRKLQKVKLNRLFLLPESLI
ncbi:toprim domain-containing protein [Xanthocytophaga flava]|uniref:toprim domain-containing protein n=1 Tax=Xanthocytophaga flava TaxID=3048013 RepID=UPI0028D75F75|nr:toprim domain-containing protein [Xanthocytophaga flavus]MDJ1470276.1 toprim domain-containing protein [Xanthocytophaga flavus]